MCCGEEGIGASEGAQTELPPVFEPIEHTLDDVAAFVEVCVVVELDLAVFARWDEGCGLCFIEQFTQLIGVIAAIRNDAAAFGNIRLKALTCLSNIGLVACCQMQVNRTALTIADQVQLRIQSAFGLADAAPVTGVFLTPLAAIRCALTWLASIISVDRSAFSRASASKIRSKTPASDQRL